MNEWHKISTLEGLDQFLVDVGIFHDGIVKELHWVNRDFVSESLSMRPYQLSDARLLVQRQWKDPSAVEIYFESIWSVELNTVDFVVRSTARTEPSNAQLGSPRSLLVLDIDGSKFSFERMFWRNASEWMGAEQRFGPFTTPF